jgi:hypothetical protein
MGRDPWGEKGYNSKPRANGFQMAMLDIERGNSYAGLLNGTRTVQRN